MTSSPASQRSTKPLRVIAICLIVLGLLAAGITLWQRVQAESASRAVDIVVDYTEIGELATLHGTSVDDILARMRKAGATAVALPEETLNGLEAQGALVVNRTPAIFADDADDTLPPAWSATGPVTQVTLHDPITAYWVVRALARVLPTDSVYVTNEGMRHHLYLRGSRELLGTLGLGLHPQKVSGITRANLRVMPRLHGGTALSAAQLNDVLAATAELLPPAVDGRPRATVIFEGDTLPGYRVLMANLADGLQQHNLTYGAVEFAQQKGDAQLSAQLDGHLVRVHSIPSVELTTLTDSQAVQRFMLAAKDRNIRVLYARFPSLASEDPVQSAETYVRAIAAGITQQGLTVAPDAPAHPFPTVAVATPMLTLLFAAAGASVLLWLVMTLPTTLPVPMVRGGWMVVGLGVGVAAGLAVANPSLGRTVFGVLAGIAFPLLALTWTYGYVRELPARRDVRPLVAAVAALLVATAVTLIGGLLVAAMFTETRYLVKVGQFAGVKLTLALPLLLFALLIITDGVARVGESFTDYRTRISCAAHDFMRQPVYLWGIVIAAVALVTLALLMARSGNDGMAASGVELRFRAALEQFLVARPRTKEFLIGHPLFLGGIVAAATGRRTLGLFLLLGGAIGQVNVFNTYCHAHTPILLSLLRTFHGLWLGLAIGVLAIVIIGRQALQARDESTPVTAE